MKTFSRRMIFIAAGCVAMFASQAGANVIVDYPITVDTYADSQSPANNYGVSTSLKIVVNGNDGSLCRVFIQMPSELGSISAADVVSVGATKRF